MRLAVVLLAMSVMVGCTSSNEAKRVLENDGYTEIELTGYRPFACSDSDTFQTGFRAKKAGRSVSGTVCSGFLKGNTIRLD